MTEQFLIGKHRNFIYLVADGGEAFVVDPQSDLTPWQARLEQLGARLTGVLLTHTHWDHVAGVPAIVAQYNDVPVYVHETDALRLRGTAAETERRIRFISDGQKLRVGGVELEVLHTPGHSAGECCYFMEAAAPPQLFTGDTVFVGDVGRTDLETGSTSDMFATIQRLKRLPPETIVYPGHDYGKSPTSTIARETRESAAFRCATVKELDALP